MLPGQGGGALVITPGQTRLWDAEQWRADTLPSPSSAGSAPYTASTKGLQ